MAKKQRKYDMEYKIQAVKLAKELGGAKAAAESGIPGNTMYAWTKAAREGRLDTGPGSHTPQTAMTLAEEVLFLPSAVGSLQKAENDVHCHKDRGRHHQGKNFFLLPDTESNPAGIL